MDRYFARLQAGKYVYRVNWSISMTSTLYIDGGHHSHEDEDEDEPDEPPPPPQIETEDGKEKREAAPGAAAAATSHLSDARVRCELQTLFALPRSGARVLSVHTYLYPLQQIKDDGAADQLCDAIDGLARGNVPGIARYKRAAFWGESVKEFMRQT